MNCRAGRFCKQKEKVMQKSYKKYFAVFVLPALAAYALSFLIPLGMGVFLSFCKFKTLKNATVVGLDNYIYLFTKDKTFLPALWFTVKVTVVGVLTTNVIAYALALLLSRKMKGTNVFRTIFFMPNLIGGIVLGYIWQLLLNGILIRLTGADITFSSTYGYWGLIILYNWQKIGYLMIIYIAGIQSISGDLLEAAEIDGANKRQILSKIILPLTTPSITICLFLTLTDTFKMYDQNLALTGGAPANQTRMLAMDIYETYYNRRGFAGIGQAKAVIFTILVLLIAMIQLRITRSKEVEN